MPDDVAYMTNDRVDAEELAMLYATVDWVDTRSINDIEAMLRQTPVQVTARRGQQLVGFARALSDGRFRAMVEDVIVAPGCLRRGIGRGLVVALIDALSGIDEIQLSCRDELVPFYIALGFERSSIVHMCRAKRPA